MEKSHSHIFWFGGRQGRLKIYIFCNEYLICGWKQFELCLFEIMNRNNIYMAVIIKDPREHLRRQAAIKCSGFWMKLNHANQIPQFVVYKFVVFIVVFIFKLWNYL